MNQTDHGIARNELLKKYGITYPLRLNILNEDIFLKAALEAEDLDNKFYKYQRENDALFLTQFKDFANKCWGNTSKEAKYVNKLSLPSLSNRAVDGVRYAKNDWLKKKEEIDKANQQIEQDKTRKELENQAYKYLLERIPADAINISDIIEQAEEIAFKEAVTATIRLGGYHEFQGQNCDACEGWDGTSHRCECGNRRVSWCKDGLLFNGTGYIYGEAY